VTEERTPTDGLPYYCILCGAGWTKYNQCERTTCILEAMETARARQQEGKQDD